MDGLILLINRDFLTELEKRGLKVLSLRVRYLYRNTSKKGNKYKPFYTLKEYTDYHNKILSSNNPLCSAGDFPVIENIEIKNVNLSFTNEFRWYNIMGKRTVVESINYDSFRKDYQNSEVERYRILLNKLLDNYINNINKAIRIRLDSYVDPCYVDAGYVSPNSEPGSTNSIASLLEKIKNQTI